MLRELSGPSQVGDRPAFIERVIGDEKGDKRLPVPGGHLDGEVRRLHVVRGVLVEYEPLTGAKFSEFARTESLEAFLKVDYLIALARG